MREKLYIPAFAYGHRIDAEHYALAREVPTGKCTVRAARPQVSIRAEGPARWPPLVRRSGRGRGVCVLGSLRPGYRRVERRRRRDHNESARCGHPDETEP